MTVRTFRLLELTGGDFVPSDVDIAVDDFADIQWASVAVLAAKQPLDADLTAIAALSTSSFGRSLLTGADAAATRTTIGAGTSSFSGAASDLTGTTLASGVATSSLTSTGILTGGATGAGFTVALTTSTVTGTLPAAQMPALTGDITTSAGAVATTIAAGVVSLAKMAALAPSTILGNNTITPATPLALPASSVKTLLAIASTDVSGLGTLATQSGTFSGTSSGTNTGDQTTVSGSSGSCTGNALTATTLQTARAINGTNFDGSGPITIAAAGSTLTGSSIAAGMLGTSATTACAGNDSRLSDTRTPTAHASTHLPGGTDALTTATAGASAPGDTAAAGTAASFARSDHTHGRESIMGPSSQPAADQTLLANSITILYDDPLVVASGNMVWLSSDSVCWLSESDAASSNIVCNTLGNTTLNSRESTIIPGLLIIANNGLFWLNDDDGVSLVAII